MIVAVFPRYTHKVLNEEDSTFIKEYLVLSTCFKLRE